MPAGDDGDGSPTSAPTSADAGTSAPATSTTTPSSTGTADDSDDEDSEEEGSVLLTPDGACFAHCASFCDVWAQDCPKGEKCMPWDQDGGSAWNAGRCSSLIEPLGVPDDPCVAEGSQWSGIDDCQIGAMCWDVDPDTNAGTCAGFCLGSEANPVCDGEDRCFMAYDGWINLCLAPCDPLTPLCEAGLACVESYSRVHPDVFACVPASLVADRSTYAAGCDDVIGCGTGLLCTVPEDVPACASECCTMLCDPLAANVCPDAAAGQVCIAHAETPTLGHCGFR